MSEQTYRQCEMGCGDVRRTSWLPAEFAKVGTWVRIGVQHWKILSAHKTAVTMEFLSHVRDAQKQRESTVR